MSAATASATPVAMRRCRAVAVGMRRVLGRCGLNASAGVVSTGEMVFALEAADEVPPAQRGAVRGQLEKLARYVDEPIEVRATVHRTHGCHGERPYILDAQLDHNGRR